MWSPTTAGSTPAEEADEVACPEEELLAPSPLTCLDVRKELEAFASQGLRDELRDLRDGLQQVVKSELRAWSHAGGGNLRDARRAQTVDAALGRRMRPAGTWGSNAEPRPLASESFLEGKTLNASASLNSAPCYKLSNGNGALPTVTCVEHQNVDSVIGDAPELEREVHSPLSSGISSTYDAIFPNTLRLPMNVEPVSPRRNSLRNSIDSNSHGSSRLRSRRHSVASTVSRLSQNSGYYVQTHPRSHGSTFLSTRVDLGLEDQGSTADESVLERIVCHPHFDLAIMILILLNGLSIGAQTEYMAWATTDEVPLLLRIIEVFFCTCFTLELAVRIFVDRCFFFYGPDLMWNWFDMLVVALQLTEEVISLVASSVDPGGDRSRTNFSFVRTLRVLRLVRIGRLIRILRFITELRTIVTSIGSSMRHLFWTVMLLVLMVYTLGVAFTQMVLDYRLQNPEEDLGLLKCWSTLGRSSLTLFEAISGGIDWDIAVTPLAEKISVFMAPICCLYIAFALLALMNVVTGVFVENAIDSANQDKERYLVQTARDVFKKADPEGTGVITWMEFEQQLNKPELQGYFRGLGIDTQSARGLFKMLDLDGSGSLDADELLTGTLRLRGGAKAIDLAALIYENRRLSRRFQQYARLVEKIEKQVALIASAPRQISSPNLRVASSAGPYSLPKPRLSFGFESCSPQEDDPKLPAGVPPTLVNGVVDLAAEPAATFPGARPS